MSKQLTIDTWKQNDQSTNFIIVPITVFYLPNSCKHTKLIFSNNQYHDITFLPKKLSNYSSFFFQLFKIYIPIFQVRQVNICPESCKRSQIYAGWIPAAQNLSYTNFRIVFIHTHSSECGGTEDVTSHNVLVLVIFRSPMIKSTE